jgi:hypothetical protein
VPIRPLQNADSSGFLRFNKMTLKPVYLENLISNTTLCMVTQAHIIFHPSKCIGSFRYGFEVLFFSVIKHLSHGQARIQKPRFSPFSGVQKIFVLLIKHLTFSKTAKTVILDPEKAIMITNTRLQELRATGIACQIKTMRNGATHLEKEFADLYQICLDNLPSRNVSDAGEKVSGQSMGPHINILLGK